MNISRSDDPTGIIESRILTIRGCRVIMDRDLAEIYGVTTKRLNEQVRRNREKFPSDFLLEIQPHEKNELVANCDRFRNIKHSNVLPLAFTEHGALMAASVLNSPVAVETSILVVRAFVRLREVLSVYRDLENRVCQLEGASREQREAIETVIQLLEQLRDEDSSTSPHRIGFTDQGRGEEGV
jgi:hypothetical protein